ncbi:hypothetical protein FPV67DRAFT_1454475 [Lyophyllum atratum]|nr:hypothetical protein FPV67DRAFT_1454475 [Lyophyllum atratum]
MFKNYLTKVSAHPRSATSSNRGASVWSLGLLLVGRSTMLAVTYGDRSVEQDSECEESGSGKGEVKSIVVGDGGGDTDDGDDFEERYTSVKAMGEADRKALGARRKEDRCGIMPLMTSLM